jgi:acyl-coenzyme A thioesterase PaaI-like protein
MDQLALLRKTWDRLSKVPGGAKVFGKLVGRMAPYTGTIDPIVAELRPGYARVQMKDRRAVRNHLKSIHAVALMNLAEVSSGLAFSYSLPSGSRGILTGLSIEYVKKARGTLTAECHSVIPETNERAEYEVEVVTRDESGDVVTRATAQWLVGPLR